ncbi:hypothetical protein ACP4OV_017314 [Aristida adscensionis]
MALTTADGDAAGEKSTFRCLDAARYAVAAVVTVFIVAVVGNAIRVVLRPDTLRLAAGGAVSSTPDPASHAVLLSLTLRTDNPSDRVRMYFVNLSAYLFDSNTTAATANPGDDSFIVFPLPDLVVRQQVSTSVDSSVLGQNENMNPPFFDMLYAERETIAGVTLRVDGDLVTEVRSGINRTRQRSYYCWPLVVVGGDQGAAASWPDVPCTTDKLGDQ